MTLIVVGIAGGASALALLMELVVFMTVNQAMQKLGAGAQTNPGPGSSTSSSISLLIPSGTYLVVHYSFPPCHFNRFMDDPYPPLTSSRCFLVDLFA